MTYLLIGLLLGVLGIGWYGFERQRDAYEQMIDILTADREQARHEAKVFRSMLFPSIARMDEAAMGEEGNGPRHPSSPTGVAAASPKPAPAQKVRSRIPFRLRFNIERRKTNTPQQKTDALAEALSKIPKQEKNHVS